MIGVDWATPVLRENVKTGAVAGRVHGVAGHERWTLCGLSIHIEGNPHVQFSVEPDGTEINCPGCLDAAARRAWVYDDGGRADAGFRGDADDCVTRAVAIAFRLPYADVYRELADRQAGVTYRGRGGVIRTKGRSARESVLKKVYKPYLLELGAVWTPTTFIGSGCKVHLRADELPPGRLIVEVSKHVVAVIDGVIYDTHDPTRDGTRCVYGYYTVPT